MKRTDGRKPGDLRPTRLTRGVNPYAEGSCLIECGETHVLVTASVEKSLPRWLAGSGKGWVTAEYAMLPRANRQRSGRERSPSGRSQEIQRLIGRSLRAVTDLKALGEVQITLDCDVLRADGGTRCASINAAYVALSDAVDHCLREGIAKGRPLTGAVVAVSAGIVGGEMLLDLDYAEDSAAAVDANFVLTGSGRLVEVQATGEEATFDRDDLDRLLTLAESGARRIHRLQRAALKAAT